MSVLAVSEQPMGELRAARFSFEHDGERVPGSLFLPMDWDEPMPLVFIQHPLMSSKDDYFVREPSIMWARRGWVCVGMDAPYHGDREDPDPMLLIRDAGEYEAVVDQFGEELARAIELIAGQYPVDLGRMGYVGYSFGSAIGVPAVARDGRFKAASFCLVGEGGVGGGGGPGAAAPRLGDTAVRIVGKVEDELIPRSSTEALYAAIPGTKDIVWLPGGHYEIGPDVVQAAGDWLRSRL